MSKIISDFVKCAGHSNGFGYFEGDELASSYARFISSNQRRKFERYGTIPRALFNYLKHINAIQSNVYVPEESRTVKALLDLLAETPTNKGHQCSEGEALRVALLIGMMPWIERSLGSAQYIWRVLETGGKLYGLKKN